MMEVGFTPLALFCLKNTRCMPLQQLLRMVDGLLLYLVNKVFRMVVNTFLLYVVQSIETNPKPS